MSLSFTLRKAHLSVIRPLTLRASLRYMSSTNSSTTPIEDSIRSKLSTLLQPQSLSISNDSWQHRHHAPMKAIGGGSGETHFSVNVVSDAFEGQRTMQRHRMIYGALSDEFEQGLHALSLNTKTPKEITTASNTLSS